MNLTVVQRAYQRLQAAGVRGTLVGTAALQLRGYLVDSPDVDFLCERALTPAEVGPDAVPGSVEERDGAGMLLDGVKVDFIGKLDEGRERFFNPERADVVAGVPVAALEDVIGLKRWAGRPKDVAFLAAWDTGAVPRL